MSKSARLSLFEERLKALFILRRDAARKGIEIVWEKDGGLRLYDEALEEICRVMLEIKKKFPDRVSRCDLFTLIEEPVWREKFKRNFYKLFIDRIHCKSDGDNLHMQFNKKDFGTNSHGADLCYGEGFVIGFLSMLGEVIKQFESEEKSELSEEDFIRLLIEFNKIVTGSEENMVDGCRQFGIGAIYDDAVRRKAAQDKCGENKAFYHFPNSQFMLRLHKGFDHKQSAINHYKLYLRQRLQVDCDEQSLPFLMTSSIPSSSHLCADGNARSALLFGWMMAIMHNEILPLAVNPYFVERQMVIEAKKWIKTFVKNPDCPVLSYEVMDLYKHLLIKNTLSAELEIIAVIFLSDLFQKTKDLTPFFEIPFSLDQKLFIGKSLDIYESFLIAKDISDIDGEEESVNFSELIYAIKARHEELIAVKDLDSRNQRIAFYFLEHVLRNPKICDEEWSRNLVSYVVEAHKPESFPTQSGYREIWQACCKNLQEYSMDEEDFAAGFAKFVDNFGKGATEKGVRKASCEKLMREDLEPVKASRAS